jgi:heptosyltransferase III
MNNPLKILIIRTDRIGDVVLTIPMAKIIKEKFPLCKVSFLVRSYTAPLLYNNKFIDEVLILSETEGRGFYTQNLKQLKDKFDFCFVVSPSFRIAFLFFLSGIKSRVGTGYRWYSFLFNKKVFEHRKYAEKNELEYNLSQLKHLGIEAKTAKNEESFGLGVDEKAKIKVKQFLIDEGIDFTKPIIIIHPGSGGSAVDLPVNRFSEIAALISNELDANLILTGSEKEHRICGEILAGVKGINLAGKFNLAELTAVINYCGIFIANSTGPLHIAAALGKWVVGFYPKITVASPKRWGPYTEKKEIFTPQIECSNCTKKQCSKLNCMESISGQMVFLSIRKMYKLLLKNGENNV